MNLNSSMAAGGVLHRLFQVAALTSLLLYPQFQLADALTVSPSKSDSVQPSDPPLVEAANASAPSLPPVLDLSFISNLRFQLRNIPTGLEQCTELAKRVDEKLNGDQRPELQGVLRESISRRMNPASRGRGELVLAARKARENLHRQRRRQQSFANSSSLIRKVLDILASKRWPFDNRSLVVWVEDCEKIFAPAESITNDDSHHNDRRRFGGQSQQIGHPTSQPLETSAEIVNSISSGATLSLASDTANNASGLPAAAAANDSQAAPKRLGGSSEATNYLDCRPAADRECEGLQQRIEELEASNEMMIKRIDSLKDSNEFQRPKEGLLAGKNEAAPLERLAFGGNASLSASSTAASTYTSTSTPTSTSASISVGADVDEMGSNELGVAEVKAVGDLGRQFAEESTARAAINTDKANSRSSSHNTKMITDDDANQGGGDENSIVRASIRRLILSDKLWEKVVNAQLQRAAREQEARAFRLRVSDFEKKKALGRIDEFTRMVGGRVEGIRSS